MGGTITALVAQKKNKDRVNVYLDGQFAFGLAAIEAIKLRRGQALSDDDIAALQNRDELEVARQQALGFLEYRPRSEAEVRRYLESKGYPPETVEPVLARLTGAGLLDDRAFGRFWLENRAAFRPRSARALRQELRQKGVAGEVIDELLDEQHDESQAAYQAALSSARKWRGLDAFSFRKKLHSLLVRRGFSYEVVREVTERIWQELEPDQSDSFDET